MSPHLPPETAKYQSVIKFIWGHRHRLIPGVSLALLRCVVIAPCPWMFQVIIDRYVPTGNILGIAGISTSFLGLLFLHYAFSVLGARHIAFEVSGMMLELRSEIFTKLHFINFAYLDRQKSGRLLSKYAFDTQKVEGVLMQVLNQFLPNLFYSLTITIILLLMDWRLALVLLVFIPLFALARIVFQHQLMQVNEQMRLAQEHLTGTASEAISALRLVRSFAAERHVSSQVDHHSQEFARSRVAMVHVNSVFGTALYAVTQGLSLVTVAGGAVFVVHGSMTMGTLLAFMAGLPIISMPINLFATLAEQYFVSREALVSIGELLLCKYVEQWDGNEQVEQWDGNITFDKVSFAYEPGQPVLTDFNLTIAAGENLALVGPSGSGKTTLTSLILGLYRPQTGTVRIDGAPLADVDMKWFRTQAAVVMQESLLLSGTIAENLKLAKPDATDEEIQSAAQMANAEEFILQLPLGYETLVGERGAMLSGGQRQRISIARALLRDPKLLILDEATSALDYHSERLVREAMENLSKGRTVITIAHRLSTIRNAARIICMQKGVIVEEGSFDDLVAKKGVFHELVLQGTEQ